ncbi:MAG: helix-turn-helix transcriptional regulator [Lachnospiraceae bacterium]|nr:helix-turn-helix transcriptional regulator [Lachnospiraceae bacterium]
MKRDITKEHAESCSEKHCHGELVHRVEAQIPAEEDLYDLADFFKVFGDTTRIKILSVLRLQEMCVCDIADSLSMTQSAISHQLRILKQMDLVKNRRDGKTIYYSLADDHIAVILDMGLEHIRE